MRLRLGVLPLLLLAGSSFAQDGPPPAAVRLDAARVETLEQWRQLTGSLRSQRQTRLSADTEGKLAALPFQEGSRVEKGDVVARLDDTHQRLTVKRRKAELASARATIVEARAELAKAERDLPRFQRLHREGQAVSQSLVDDARTELDRARARLRRAEADVETIRAALATAEQDLKDTETRAPFAGTIVTRLVGVGTWMRAGDEILELVADDVLEAWLEVPQELLPRMSDDDLQLEIFALGENIPVVDRALVPLVDEQTRSFSLRVEVSDELGWLTPGMSVEARVPAARREPTTTVHRDAIRRDDAGEFVYFDAGGLAGVARVITLFNHGERVAVRTSSLPPGAKVVIEGNERLFPGQPLADIDAPPPSDGGGGGS
ncbi:MAG: efflux RND transporter periplasmic adaptor subunit [Acidobacteriota bacterium]